MEQTTDRVRNNGLSLDYKHLMSNQVFAKEQLQKTLGMQHFIVVQYVFDKPNYRCVKCGVSAYNPELVLGKDCKINYQGKFEVENK